MLDLDFFIGTYAPIPYLDSNGVQMFALDIPYICRFLILAIIVFFMIKGIFSFMRIISN